MPRGHESVNFQARDALLLPTSPLNAETPTTRRLPFPLLVLRPSTVEDYEVSVRNLKWYADVLTLEKIRSPSPHPRVDVCLLILARSIQANSHKPLKP